MTGDSPEIHALDPDTIDRIAAGEVVERPASVVKELVENALDADASEVVVEVDAGGTERIRVADDGIGMSEDAVLTAIEPHTTSKIRSIEDLERGVETLGFRGEALHTIGAVSRLSIATRPRGADGAGTKVRLEGGDVTGVEPIGCPTGTAVEVRDLFFNTPARRKFLKTVATEFDHVNRVVTAYALGNPDVAMALEHDGRRVFRTPGQGDLDGAILAVYGREVATAMRTVAPPDDLGDAVEGIRGAVSEPEATRGSPTYCSTYVNGRAVRSGALREAILDAYGRQLAGGRYPFAVLFLEVDPSTVDVNVHPRKMEVRFDDEAAVTEAVRRTVRQTLLEHGVIRSSAPRGRSAPDETTIEPEHVGGTIRGRGAEEAVEGAATGEREGPEPDAGIEDRGSRPVPDAGAGTAGSRSSADGTVREGARTRPGAEGERPDREAGEGAPNRTQTRTPSRTQTKTKTPSQTSSAEEGRFQWFEQAGLAEAVAVSPALERLPDLRVLGQVRDTFVVAEHDDGLVLIDQHAADERIQYERLRERFEADTTTQTLVEPVPVELTAREAALYDELGEALGRLGFSARREGRTLEVTTVPTIVGDALDPTELRDVIDDVVSGEPGATIDATAEAILADLACHPAITGNTSLSEGSIVDLLEALDGCHNPYACPHGRPVLIAIPWGELEDRFERDYPGHG